MWGPFPSPAIPAIPSKQARGGCIRWQLHCPLHWAIVWFCAKSCCCNKVVVILSHQNSLLPTMFISTPLLCTYPVPFTQEGHQSLTTLSLLGNIWHDGCNRMKKLHSVASSSVGNLTEMKIVDISKLQKEHSCLSHLPVDFFEVRIPVLEIFGRT